MCESRHVFIVSLIDLEIFESENKNPRRILQILRGFCDDDGFGHCC